MLIEFNVSNFLSFRKLTSFSMIASNAYKEFENSHIHDKSNGLPILKSSIIYGNNGSGKSNLIKAISFMKHFVKTSFRDVLSDQEDVQSKKFALNTDSESEPCHFEVSFIHNNTKYRYGFEWDEKIIKSEWLFHSTSKEVFLFKRKLQVIEINKTAFKEGIGRESDINTKALFLSLLASLGKEISSTVVEWFNKIQIFNGFEEQRFKNYTVEKLKNDQTFFKWATQFVEYLEIAGLTTEEDSPLDIESLNDKIEDKEILSLFATIKKIQEKQPKTNQIVSFHKRFNADNILVGTIPFNFDKQESEGTKKLMYLLGPCYDSLKKGNILIVDELDAKFHSHLTLRIIRLFHYFNSRNAQLICTVHDMSLLNNQTFRRDQIWFIDKDQFGESELYSLGDFKTDKVRKNSAFDKNYSDGKYGAIPNFDNDENLTELFYGETEA